MTWTPWQTAAGFGAAADRAARRQCARHTRVWPWLAQAELRLRQRCRHQCGLGNRRVAVVHEAVDSALCRLVAKAKASPRRGEDVRPSARASCSLRVAVWRILSTSCDAMRTAKVRLTGAANRWPPRSLNCKSELPLSASSWKGAMLLATTRRLATATKPFGTPFKAISSRSLKPSWPTAVSGVGLDGIWVSF